MKATFEAEDPREINQLAHSTDMGIFLFHLIHNMEKGLRYKYPEDEEIISIIFVEIKDTYDETVGVDIDKITE